tara:strand:+ start:149 stop:454 length:306 start_codon:yes stop_codon:yes gene_type:complete
MNIIYNMGFDDELYDGGFEEQIQILLQPYISIGSEYPSINQLEEYEKDIHYNGYSLAYHTLLPVITIKIMGSKPFKEQGDDLLIRKIAREKVLSLITCSSS